MRTYKESTSPRLSGVIDDARRQPRFKLAVPISIRSRTCGLLNGYTADISESGIAAMLTIEVPVGEIVELSFILPSGPVMIQAIVRQRNAFRYGFAFIPANPATESIRRTCRDLDFTNRRRMLSESCIDSLFGTRPIN